MYCAPPTHPTSHTSHTSHLPQHQSISPPGLKNLVTHVLRQLTAVTLGHDERLYRQLCDNMENMIVVVKETERGGKMWGRECRSV